MRLWGLKTTALALTGALALATVAEPVWAQGRGAKRGGQTKAAAAVLDRTRGAAEAPAVVQATGVTCTIADAAFLGATAEGRKTYEVACREGLGYIVSTAPTAGGQALGFDCVAAQGTAQAAKARGQSAVECRLPGNAQPVRGLQSVVAAAGLTCTVNNARYLGETSTRTARYEIGCAEGAGYVVDRPLGSAKPTATSCFRASAGGQFQCQYTTQAQILASFQPAVSQSRRTCTVANVRPVGRNPRTNNEVLEIGCAPGQVGFFLETAANGAFAEAYDCGRFGNVACQYTAAQQAAAYTTEALTQRLRAASFDCAVSQFKRLGIEASTNREAVEIACSNRPDGAIAVVPSASTGRLEIYDCLSAPRIGQSCSLSQVTSFYPTLGAAVAASQRAKCTVTNSRSMGATSQGGVLHEVACAEGRNAIVDYRGNGRVQEVIRCINASDLFGGCKLPVAARR